MPALFSQATFDFLSQLSANNHRDWFEAHKQQYEDVFEPAAGLWGVLGLLVGRWRVPKARPRLAGGRPNQ